MRALEVELRFDPYTLSRIEVKGIPAAPLARHDAQGLTQDFFVHLLEKGTLGRADPRRATGSATSRSGAPAWFSALRCWGPITQSKRDESLLYVVRQDDPISRFSGFQMLKRLVHLGHLKAFRDRSNLVPSTEIEHFCDRRRTAKRGSRKALLTC